MQNKWNKAAADMKRLADSYTEKKKLPQTEIHQEIFMRTLKLLGEHCPEAEKLIRPNTEIMSFRYRGLLSSAQVGASANLRAFQ